MMVAAEGIQDSTVAPAKQMSFLSSCDAAAIRDREPKRANLAETPANLIVRHRRILLFGDVDGSLIDATIACKWTRNQILSDIF